jgi:hypothetical protein
MRADVRRAIQREAAVVPGEQVADIVRLDQPAAGEPPQHPHPHAHLLSNGGDGLWRQLSGGAKTHGLRNITGILGEERLRDVIDNFRDSGVEICFSTL